jgi:hypothetical protein
MQQWPALEVIYTFYCATNVTTAKQYHILGQTVVAGTDKGQFENLTRFVPLSKRRQR